MDFFVDHLAVHPLAVTDAIAEICRLDLGDHFIFERVKSEPLKHVDKPYPGLYIQLIAKFGKTKTYVRIDLGFGDVVKAIDYPIDLFATRRGPLFESKITLRCYPKEFIFAEKLETVLFRGESNSRMKDFHDLYSLIKIGKLSSRDIKKAVELVFCHRETSLKGLPICFKKNQLAQLEKGWALYFRRLSPKSSIFLPKSLEGVIQEINLWLKKETMLFESHLATNR